MTRDTDAPLVIKGWSILAHPQFLDTVESLVTEVTRLRTQDARAYLGKNPTKRLAAIVRLAFEIIPDDPARPEYRLGAALGQEYRHWFRAKFFQQYRLFFRYHRESRIIIYAWVNDESTKRAYESGSDAYGTFRRMLNRAKPPDDWQQLLQEASKQNRRTRAVGKRR